MPIPSSEILNRIIREEDTFTERKSEIPNERELRKVLVSFANSVPAGKSAILYLGVTDRGKIVGLNNTDAAQKKVREAAKECCPPVEYQSEVVLVEGKNVVAVVVEESRVRPHFTGQAYIRVGSECVRSSESSLDDLIASRHNVVRRLLPMLGQSVSLRIRSENRFYRDSEARIEACNAHTVKVHEYFFSVTRSYPISHVSLHEQAPDRVILTVPPDSTEQEHIQCMLRQWSHTRAICFDPPYIDRNNYISAQLLANPLWIHSILASEALESSVPSLLLLLTCVRLELKKRESHTTRELRLLHMHRSFLRVRQKQSPVTNLFEEIASVAISLEEVNEFLDLIRAHFSPEVAAMNKISLFNKLGIPLQTPNQTRLVASERR